MVEDPDGQPLALPPTEIVKGEEMFDYRSKYLPGLARKITPINLPETDIERIREQFQAMFRTFGFQVYARLDGFYVGDEVQGDEVMKVENPPPASSTHHPIAPSPRIFLNDPNTTSCRNRPVPRLAATSPTRAAYSPAV